MAVPTDDVRAQTTIAITVDDPRRPTLRSFLARLRGGGGQQGRFARVRKVILIPDEHESPRSVPWQAFCDRVREALANDQVEIYVCEPPTHGGNDRDRVDDAIQRR